jgi:hypothetical protein
MKNRIFLTCLMLALLPFTALPQSPELVNYQAVVRDATTGGELTNQPVEVIFKVLDGSPSGAILYQESHSAETNNFGLVNLLIGSGEVLAGTFGNINWGAGARWLAVEIDTGEGFEEVSNTRLISVPYALHAEVATTADNVDDADADPTNELINPDETLLIDTLLYLSEGGNTTIINLAGLANYGPWMVGPGTVYNTEAYIGIGTENPTHRLHVINSSAEPEDSVAVFASGQHSGAVNYGLAGRASGAPENRAVYGDAPGNSGTNWAGYFNNGNVHVAGQLGVGTLSPHSSLQTAGAVAGKIRYELSTDGDISLEDDDHMLVVDVTNGQGLVLLPPANSCEGRIYYIKRSYTAATNNTLQIAPSGGDLIDGTAFPILLSSTSARESRMLVSAGANGWFVMSE